MRIVGVKKIIIHDHTPGLRDEAKGFKRIAKKLLNNSAFSADALFSTSDFVKQRLIKTYCANENKCFCIPNGIPFFEVERDRSVLQQFDIDNNAVVIVGTGRANHYKGVDFALRCIQKISNSLKDISIVYLYCGDGPDLESFISLSKTLGIDHVVRFPGRVNGLQQVCAACDIAFHPSLGEVGYSLSILEYMRAKLPVVVPDNPSVCGATQHKETGLIYKQADIDEAAACLTTLIQSEGYRRALGLKGSETVKEQYNIKNTHQILINSFEAALEQ